MILTLDLFFGLKSKPKKEVKEKKERVKTKVVKLSYMENKEFETILDVIDELEQKVKQIDIDISTVGSDFDKLNQLVVLREELEKEINEKYERFEYLNDIHEQSLIK